MLEKRMVSLASVQDENTLCQGIGEPCACCSMFFRCGSVWICLRELTLNWQPLEGQFMKITIHREICWGFLRGFRYAMSIRLPLQGLHFGPEHHPSTPGT